MPTFFFCLHNYHIVNPDKLNLQLKNILKIITGMLFYPFTVDAFNQGAVNTSIPAFFTSNCCNPRVLFVGLDLVGNMGTCSVSLVPDIVSLRAKPNTTAVHLYPGNTTKVFFTLVNLGSKGAFSFEVTKAPELISYVIPFSVALEPNASTAGHVIIKSRGEANEVQNLTVKAVSQSNKVNEKEMALFYIQVTVSSRNIPQPTTPVPKHVRLEAVVPDDHFSMTPGATLAVNFTVKNVASAETFIFQVSLYYSGTSFKGTPSVPEKMSLL